uniref:Uncharacterized protein n=1 Tax=Strongyloides stercoralis TaxID=6248 RepID=A0A0K0EC72_STRER
MYLLSTLIFIFSLVSISSGYKVNRQNDSKGGCVIYMKPFEPEYYSIFLRLLDRVTLGYGFIVDFNDDLSVYDAVNNKIKKYVKPSVLEKFVKRLGTFNRQYPITLKLTNDLKQLPSNTYDSEKKDSELFSNKFNTIFKKY